MISLKDVYNRLLSGDCTIYDEEANYMKTISLGIINKNHIDQSEIDTVIDIIKISNLLYNNNANGYLPLDDKYYDALIVLCNNQNIQYPVGAPPVNFYNANSNLELNSNRTSHLKEVVKIVPNRDKMIYFYNIAHRTVPFIAEDFIVNEDHSKVEKKSRNTAHNYNMCGTLDKCKYVLDNDARKDGVYDSNSVSIFERDFLGKHISQGLIDPNDIHLIVSLKYDGISVENTVKGSTIISSCSRGDTANNEASDLTPILGGMEFQRAKNANIEDKEFGIKFEYIITDYNLNRIRQRFGIDYVNRRNAVIGIFGRLDARQLRDYLTPVPLESSLNIDRITEIEFLNRYYTKGETLRYIEVRGNYSQVLYQVNEFVKEANTLREMMPFAYDGVVVEYFDKSLRDRLGKLNSIPRYAIAIKFNPLKRTSIFTHYTYSVGQSGVIIPMAHFKPVEFFGAIHDKTTIHSLARFRKLCLKPGDKVNLSLNNDVIVYLTKAPDEEQPPNNNPYEEFPTTCPSCGSQLYESDSGDTAYCINFMCPERCIARLSNMLAKLNIKGISNQSIRILGFKTARELFSSDRGFMESKLGVNGGKLYDAIQKVKNACYPDYRIIGSLGFTGIASATWKTILKSISLEEIVNCKDDELEYLKGINGIGQKIVDTIKKERKYFKEDLYYILSTFKYKKTEKSSMQEALPIVIFTGFRDERLKELFESKGFEVKESTPTKKTYMLVVPYIGFQSTKVSRAFELLGNRVGVLEGVQKALVDYSNYAQFTNITPYIMDINQALNFITNYNK